LFFNSEIPPKR